MSRNLARASELLQTVVNRAPTIGDIKDGRCPKCGCQALAKTIGESDISCIMCGAVIYDTPASNLTLDQVA